MRAIYLFVLVLLLISCDPEPEISYGCPFPPAHSKFPAMSSECEECFFNIQFNSQEYNFTGSQFRRSSTGPNWDDYKKNLTRFYGNTFFSFYFVSPASLDLLQNALGVRTPLMSLDSLFALANSTPPPVTVSFGLSNYCKDFFENSDDNDQSYHELVEVELIESYPFTIQTINDSVPKPYQKFIFYCTGELESILVIDGKEEPVTVRYRIRAEIWEEL